MKLSEARENIGRKVVYTPFKDCEYYMKETGVITSTNNKFVFVRYGNDVNSKATMAEDLELEVKLNNEII